MNTAVGAYGLWINPLARMLYFGIDTFYPGGWPAAAERSAGLEQNERRMTGHPFFNNSALKL